MKVKKLVTFLIVIMCLAGCFLISVMAESNEESNYNDGSLHIEFFPLGNGSGDCAIIRIGDVQILVDAGYAATSALQINSKIKEFKLDDKGKIWDYVIATHADRDHIAAFSTNEIESKDTGVFKEIVSDGWAIKQLIDFDITKDNTISGGLYDNLKLGKATFFMSENKETHELKLKEDYVRYSTTRDRLIEEKKIIDYLPASKCYGQSFPLDNSAKLHILYNYYYDHRSSDSEIPSSAECNNLSVCFLITYGEQSFLFTGDLEERDSNNDFKPTLKAETMLLQNNMDLLNGGVTFYKAAHHGSYTSNSEEFMKAIKPQVIVIPAVAGEQLHASSVYGTFPHQKVLDIMMAYTSEIYIPSEYVEKDNGLWTTSDYYGTIHIIADGSSYLVQTDIDDATTGETPPIIDTEWFLKNREAKCDAYLFDTNGEQGLTQCVLIKYADIDILLNCGINGRYGETTNSKETINELEQIVVDGIIEYVITSNEMIQCLSGMVDNGVFERFQIENLIDFGNNVSNIAPGGWLDNYIKLRDQGLKDGTIKNHYHGKSIKNQVLCEGLSICFYNKITVSTQKDLGENSICVLVEFFGEKMLFTADSKTVTEKKLMAEAGNNITNVTLYAAAFNGHESANSGKFLKTINADYIVITAPLGIAMNTRAYPTRSACKTMLATSRTGVYASSSMKGSEVVTLGGDMVFKIVYKDGNIQKDLVSLNGTVTKLLDTEWYKE